MELDRLTPATHFKAQKVSKTVRLKAYKCEGCNNLKFICKYKAIRKKTNLCAECSRHRPNSTNYYTLHWRIRQKLGSPKCCSTCGVKNSKTKHNRSRVHWAKVSDTYSDNPKDYRAMCLSCHHKFDNTIRNIIKGKSYGTT